MWVGAAVQSTFMGGMFKVHWLFKAHLGHFYWWVWMGVGGNG